MSDNIYQRYKNSLQIKSGSYDYYRAEFRAMGTICQIDYQAQSNHNSNEFITEALEWLASFESRYSRYIPDSLISIINQRAGKIWTDIDDETESILQLCDWYYWLTDGYFDPTAFVLGKLWDYQAETYSLPNKEKVNSTLSFVDWKNCLRENKKIILAQAGMALDFGGIGKEYAVDRVLDISNKYRIENILINFGADIRAKGKPLEDGPWRIGLENPTDPGSCWCGLAIQNRAVASSGDYLRYMEFKGKRYGHIINPKTGYPVDNECLAVSIIAPTCTEAGILATVAFILGPEKGKTFIERQQQAAGAISTKHDQILTERFKNYVI